MKKKKKTDLIHMKEKEARPLAHETAASHEEVEPAAALELPPDNMADQTVPQHQSSPLDVLSHHESSSSTESQGVFLASESATFLYALPVYKEGRTHLTLRRRLCFIDDEDYVLLTPYLWIRHLCQISIPGVDEDFAIP
ncbi:hypothetical protein M6B38_173605 [Iris pallida]|uniref:Uncharacterized protein n=1 Tax=Iris pallida TaxID=29817 RepID=A0AAX6ESS4_IRIPA|nr:hypothetical protein M6B38_173605 [Iris pallida]